MGIGVLGPLAVDGNGALPHRDRVVLSALVVRAGQAASSEELADVLWGERPPHSWNKVVPGCVNRLRKVLGAAAIVTSPEGYRLAVSGDAVDARRFERLVAKGHQMLALGETDRAIHAFREALALWRGPALRDVEDWPPAQAEVQRWEELRRETEEAVLDASLRLGLQAGILAEARARVLQAPMRERRWAILALAQYLSGSQAEALATLRRAREMLMRELALQPGTELVDLERAMLRQDPGLSAATVLPRPVARCPYPGLLPYDVGDADSFFGRASDLAAIRQRLLDSGLLVLVGPSGSGKSSLVRAGLVASLGQDGVTCVMPSPGTSQAELLALLSTPDPDAVLVLDQLEEVVARCGSTAERLRLATALTVAAERQRLVLVIRADRFGDVSDLPGFGRLVERGLMVLGPLGEEALREAIEGPARGAALLLEPGLVDVLLHDVRDDPGALPLLSHALRETWERREGRTLTVEGYRSTGGIRGAVARSAEQVYEDLSERDRAKLRDLMLRLLTLAPDGEPLRSAVPRGAIPADNAHQALVETLVQARLVTADADVIDLAHETLARAWPRLRGWLDDDLDGQRILRHLSAAAESWHAMGRPDAELYRGERLRRAADWQQSSGSELTEAEAAFLARSREVAEEEADARRRESTARRRSRQRFASLVGVATTLALAAGVAATVAVRERDRAEAERLLASARRAATLSQGSDDVARSLLLAVEAVRRDDSLDSRATLLTALTRRPALVGVIDTDTWSSVDVSSDGEHLLVTDWRLRVLDAETRRRVGRPRDPGSGAEFTHRGTVLRFDDRVVEEQDLAGRRLRRFDLPVQLRDWGVVQATSAADGSRVLALLEREAPSGEHLESALVVWDADTAPRRGWWSRVRQRVSHVALDRDGGRVFAVGGAGTWLTVYDADSGRALQGLPASAAIRRSLDPLRVRTSPAEDLLALNDGTDVVVLDGRTLGEVVRLRGHARPVTALEFSDDGRRIAAGAADGTVLTWRRSSGAVVDRLTGPPVPVTDLAYSADGRLLFSATQEPGVLVWDLGGQRRFVSQVNRERGLFGGLSVLAPDGESVAYFTPTPTTFGRDSRFDLLSVGAAGRTSVSADYANWGAYSPDGGLLTTVAGSRVQVWEARTGRLVDERTVPGIENGEAVTYADDGDQLVVADREGLVVALDSATLAPEGRAVDVRQRVMDLVPLPQGGGVVVLLDADGYVVVDLARGEADATVRLGLQPTYGAVSPDGRRLVLLGWGGDLGMVDLRTGDWLAGPVDAHAEYGTRVDFGQDGSRFATSGPDGRVILWEGSTGRRLATIRPSGPGSDLGLVFLEDGHTLQMADSQGRVFRWDTRPTAWQEFACRAAGRNLEPGEWREAFGEEPYRWTCPQWGPGR